MPGPRSSGPGIWRCASGPGELLAHRGFPVPAANEPHHNSDDAHQNRIHQVRHRSELVEFRVELTRTFSFSLAEMLGVG